MEVFARSQRQAYTPIRTPFNVLAPNPSRSLCDIPKVGVKISFKKCTLCSSSVARVFAGYDQIKGLASSLCRRVSKRRQPEA
jgi:hypothetical protein